MCSRSKLISSSTLIVLLGVAGSLPVRVMAQPVPQRQFPDKAAPQMSEADRREIARLLDAVRSGVNVPWNEIAAAVLDLRFPDWKRGQLATALFKDAPGGISAPILLRLADLAEGGVDGYRRDPGAAQASLDSAATMQSALTALYVDAVARGDATSRRRLLGGIALSPWISDEHMPSLVSYVERESSDKDWQSTVSGSILLSAAKHLSTWERYRLGALLTASGVVVLRTQFDAFLRQGELEQLERLIEPLAASGNDTAPDLIRSVGDAARARSNTSKTGNEAIYLERLAKFCAQNAALATESAKEPCKLLAWATASDSDLAPLQRAWALKIAIERGCSKEDVRTSLFQWRRHVLDQAERDLIERKIRPEDKSLVLKLRAESELWKMQQVAEQATLVAPGELSDRPLAGK